jgi:hypothetical protein
MTCRIQIVGDGQWRFCPVDPPREASRLQCVARATLIDDLIGGPPPVALTVTTDTPGLSGRSGPEGLVGVVGRPYPAWPASQVAGTPLAMMVRAPGCVDLALAGSVSVQGAYPDAFILLDLGLHRLLRRPIEIRGQVARLVAGDLQPVAAATVAVTAAVPVPAIAAAVPAPPSAASFLALSAVTDAAGNFRLGPVARAIALTLTASQGGGNDVRDLDIDYAQPINLIDFVLP